MNARRPSYVFGPVPSRRLGRSLGVDLVPFKTCTFDCIYCQLGRTTCKTLERKEWVPTDAVLAEVKAKLRSRPDYVTLSGSGEPTLHARLGDIIKGIQAMTHVPVAVLTNGSLLWQKEVRREVALADRVMPSLDAPDPERFARINRPHSGITFTRLMSGLEAFRREYSGPYWLEVMLLDGYTTLDPQVQQLVEWVRRFRPDKVQLNTAARPPAEEYALAVPPERLAAIALQFVPPAEVIAEHLSGRRSAHAAPSRRRILDLLRRRPCTVEGVAHGLSLKVAEVVKILAELEARGEIERSHRSAQAFYRLANASVSSMRAHRRQGCGRGDSVVPAAGAGHRRLLGGRASGDMSGCRPGE